ncbi:hypothetical protein [Fodinibius roseus]|uniref:hypothetical protein n=1 Tax=Fodinibius roseus TaxID=1194090 RepID=UPI00147EB171|nr:hypothetical protein [Fodinibius roseus]
MAEFRYNLTGPGSAGPLHLPYGYDRGGSITGTMVLHWMPIPNLRRETFII